MKPTLFRQEDNNAADEFKKYVPVNLNLRFETIAPYIATCEQKYVQSLIGSQLMESLKSYYDADTFAYQSDNSKIGVLFEKVRYALVRLAIWEGFDAILTQVTDTGFSSAIDKENRLYRYQEENLRKSFKNEGFNALDDVLSYLDSNAPSFPGISSAPYVQDKAETLIKTTESFNECYNISGSRLVFLRMRQYVRDVELLDLKHRIGDAMYKELLTADESVARYAAILPNIRRYVVYESVAEGIGELHKMPTEKGLLFEEDKADGVELKPLEHSQMTETRMIFHSKAEKYLASAINYIILHRNDYPNYIGFAGDSPADGVIHIDNTNRKTFFV